MHADDVIRDYRQRLGWDALTVIDFLCEFIDRQKDSQSLSDFLAQKALEELCESIVEDMGEPTV